MTQWFFQFAVKVFFMRKHQKAWFLNHSQYDLIQAKRYEAEVDKELRNLLVIENGESKKLNIPDEQSAEPKQSEMFAEDEQK